MVELCWTISHSVTPRHRHVRCPHTHTDRHTDSRCVCRLWDLRMRDTHLLSCCVWFGFDLYICNTHMVLVDSADTTRVQLPQFEQSYEKQQPKQEEHSTEPIELYNALTIHTHIYIFCMEERYRYMQSRTLTHMKPPRIHRQAQRKKTLSQTLIFHSATNRTKHTHTHTLSLFHSVCYNHPNHTYSQGLLFEHIWWFTHLFQALASYKTKWLIVIT